MAQVSWENRIENRRMSLLNLSTHSEEYLRPRSHSTGQINAALRTPTPYPFNTKSFVYPSPAFSSKNEYDSPVMVVTGKSPSILDCTNLMHLRTSTRSKFKLILGIFVTLFVILVGGILLSIVATKSKVSCIGDHFCYPANVPIPKLFHFKVEDSEMSSTEQIQDAVQKAMNKREEKTNKDRIVKPRIIPKFIGTIDVKTTENNKPEVDARSAAKIMSAVPPTMNVNDVDAKMHKERSPENVQRLGSSFGMERGAKDSWNDNSANLNNRNAANLDNRYSVNFDKRNSANFEDRNSANLDKQSSINFNKPVKKGRSPFMAQNSHYENDLHYEDSHHERQFRHSQYSERERYFESERKQDFNRNYKRNFHPPGVNPRVYDRAYEL